MEEELLEVKGYNGDREWEGDERREFRGPHRGVNQKETFLKIPNGNLLFCKLLKTFKQLLKTSPNSVNPCIRHDTLLLNYPHLVTTFS